MAVHRSARRSSAVSDSDGLAPQAPSNTSFTVVAAPGVSSSCAQPAMEAQPAASSQPRGAWFTCARFCRSSSVPLKTFMSTRPEMPATEPDELYWWKTQWWPAQALGSPGQLVPYQATFRGRWLKSVVLTLASQK